MFDNTTGQQLITEKGNTLEKQSFVVLIIIK